jgi:hypothetical protein
MHASKLVGTVSVGVAGSIGKDVGVNVEVVIGDCVADASSVWVAELVGCAMMAGEHDVRTTKTSNKPFK